MRTHIYHIFKIASKNVLRIVNT